jgi:hypothetical protein
MNSVKVTDGYRRVAMRQKYTVTQQFFAEGFPNL